MQRETLVVTNDFGPRAGGIESFVNALVERLPRDSVVVHTSDQPGAPEYDKELFDRLGIVVVRDPMKMLVPTPLSTRRVVETLTRYGSSRVWFGAAAPLGLMAPALRNAGAKRIVATTHGHELWWAKVPGSRQLMHRIGESVDVMTYLGEYTKGRIASALSREARAHLVQLTPGVDVEHFRPKIDVECLKEKLGLTDRLIVVTVGRLVPRKGQDRLIKAIALLAKRFPTVALVICGDGPYLAELIKLVSRLGLESNVLFTGRVSWKELPAYFSLGDLFAMPSRSRWAGLEVEGLGIVYLEASACGLPVIAGNSGGAPDAVIQGETGFVVDGNDVKALAEKIELLLTDRLLAQRLGTRGSEWAIEKWRWEEISIQHQRLLGIIA